MRHKLKHILPILILFIISTVNAQETINADNPNNFVTGGGQEFSGATIELLPIEILDIEGFTGFNSGISTSTLEAGLPVVGGTSDLSNIWLNFTYRSQSFQPAKIYVSYNLPLHSSIKIDVKIESNNYGLDGDFPKNPNLNNVTISQIENIIVYDFVNGYTGDGVGNGYKLNYTIINPQNRSFPEGFEIIYRIGN